MFLQALEIYVTDVLFQIFKQELQADILFKPLQPIDNMDLPKVSPAQYQMLQGKNVQALVWEGFKQRSRC